MYYFDGKKQVRNKNGDRNVLGKFLINLCDRLNKGYINFLEYLQTFFFFYIYIGRQIFF